MADRRITSKTKIYQVKILLLGVRPPVWRRVQVPGDMTLAELHEVVQCSLGWTDSHLHEFEIDGERYGVPDPNWGDDRVCDEAKARLSRVAAEGGRIRYVYDFGDNWGHDLIVEKVMAPEPGVRYPRCAAGKRACPPEDVGGPGGYDNFLDAIKDPGHTDHEHYADWGVGFDPAEFDLAATEKALDPLAWIAGKR